MNEYYEQLLVMREELRVLLSDIEPVIAVYPLDEDDNEAELRVISDGLIADYFIGEKNGEKFFEFYTYDRKLEHLVTDEDAEWTAKEISEMFRYDFLSTGRTTG